MGALCKTGGQEQDGTRQGHDRLLQLELRYEAFASQGQHLTTFEHFFAFV